MPPHATRCHEVHKNGSLSFAGRADKFFVNNEGREFDAGIVERAVAAHEAVSQCAIVPVMDKRIHDTVPVLYVVPSRQDADAAQAIRDALVDVYVRDGALGADSLPLQLVLVDDIPLNANGKLDIFAATLERLDGDAYSLIPVREGGQLRDIRMEHVGHPNSVIAGTLSEGMENRSAYSIYDVFTAASPTAPFGFDISRFNPFAPWEMFVPDREQKKELFKLPEIPPAVMKVALKYGNRLAGIPNGRKHITFDFED